MAYTTIDNPALFFNTLLWTGDGASTRSITGVGFQPDWIWVKCRSTGHDHYSWDSVRTNKKGLEPSDTSAERTPTLGSIDSDGFSFSGLDGFYNANSDTYVGWNWRAGNSSGSSNGDGSITSTVSANTTAGFSVVSYTGTGSAATIGHGLGSAPLITLIKQYSSGGTGSGNWNFITYQIDGSSDELTLNGDGAKADRSITAPTSSVFSVDTSDERNDSGQSYICYCFAEVKGFSKFGKYNGNGNADGTFVYTGFKPAFLIVKISSGQNEWTMRDNKRDVDNSTNHTLYPNLSSTEAGGSGEGIDFLSNGFKLRLSAGSLNGSGSSYIYMAFAENPFVTAGTKAAGTAR